MKRCPDCCVTMPLDAFPAHKSSKDGRRGYCHGCTKTRYDAWFKEKYGSYRNYHLIQKYGMSEADFDSMVEAQNGLCAACKKRPATQVDHDHSTGKVRGIVCLPCNAAMGALKDDPQLVWMAVDYLENARGNTVEILNVP